MPGDCHYLNIRLQLEQQRLLSWGEASGLLELDSGQWKGVAFEETFGGATRHLILDQLMQVQLLVKDFEKWHLRYIGNDKEDVEARSEEKPDTGLSGATLFVQERISKYPRRNDLLKKALRGVREVQHIPKYFVWASWDKSKFQSMLEHLTNINNGILSIVGNNMQKEIHRATLETSRGVLQLYSKVDDLDQLVKALKLELGQKQTGNAETLPKALSEMGIVHVQQVDQLAELATFKSFNTSMIERQELPNDGQETPRRKTLTQIERMSLKPADVEIIDNDNRMDEDFRATRCRAVYRQTEQSRTNVWVEWKFYESPPRGQSGPEPLVMERLQKLAALLHKDNKPAGFRVPRCIGYLDESVCVDKLNHNAKESRIGFVFEYPDAAIPSSQPTSLRQIIRNCRQGDEPSLTERIEVANILANTLSCLHSVNWLHKALRSANVVFFLDASRNDGFDLSKPYLCGFDFSRPSYRDEMTELPPNNPEFDVYRHPHAHGQSPGVSFRKSYDIYSVGVILIEIAHWKCIEEILMIENLSLARSARTRRSRESLLSKSTMDQLAAKVGTRYQNVVKACLDGSLESVCCEATDDEMQALSLSEAFQKNVVQSLNKIRC